MRKSIQIKLAQQAQRKNTYFSLVFAICTLSILFFVDVFKTLEFLAFMPFAYLIFINLSIFMKKSDQDKINKEPSFLIYISIIASLIIANLYLFTNYSNFKSINALEISVALQRSLLSINTVVSPKWFRLKYKLFITVSISFHRT